jgi:hypothetical protein
MTSKKALALLALVLVAAAIAAPAASAYTEPSFSGFYGDETSSNVRVVEVPSDSGFQWGDAAIGAGATLALVLVGLGATLAAIGVRHRHAVAYHPVRPSAS